MQDKTTQGWGGGGAGESGLFDNVPSNHIALRYSEDETDFGSRPRERRFVVFFLKKKKSNNNKTPMRTSLYVIGTNINQLACITLIWNFGTCLADR